MRSNSRKWILIVGSKLDELNFAAILGEKGVDTTGDLLISPIEHTCNHVLAQEFEKQGFIVRKSDPGDIVNGRAVSHRVQLPDYIERKDWWLKPKPIR